MPYRLYNLSTHKFYGPPETKLQALKRLSSLTNRKRDHATNWLRLCVYPMQVLEQDHSVLSPKAGEELRALREFKRRARRFGT